MTTEEIKRIVDDERAEQLTAQLCHHWDVATQRLDTLAQEVTNGMDTCAEAEIYAALIRMQRDGSGDGSLIRPEIRKETTKQNHKRVMQSGSWILATGPNNGHQLRDYSKSSNRSENRPLI